MQVKQWRRIGWIAIGLGLVLGVLGYAIGEYFVSFALIPNRGGESRQVQSHHATDAFRLSPKSAQRIQTNKDKANARRDQWLQAVSDMSQSVQITSHDHLQLHGHTYVQKQTSHRWVILVHGYQSSEEDALQLAPAFYREGYNILSVDMRSHDQSEGQYIGMGILDRHDLKAWTDFIIDKDAQAEIVYHGTSMGGATVLMASSLDLPSNVKAIISDCAYTSVWEIFASELDQRFNLPAFPVLYLADTVAGLKAGYHFNQASPQQAMSQNHLPILFIHTQKDDFVPVTMLEKLYQADVSKEKAKLIIEDGHHADAKHADPDRYYATIFQFLETYVAP